MCNVIYNLQTRILLSKSTVQTTIKSNLFRNVTECITCTWTCTVLTSLPTILKRSLKLPRKNFDEGGGLETANSTKKIVRRGCFS